MIRLDHATLVAARVAKARAVTRGFGCPEVPDVDYWILSINRQVVTLAECSMGSYTPRACVSRTKWRALADGVRGDFNTRLRSRKIKAGTWTSETPIERLLGRELCVLLWGAEGGSSLAMRAALGNWLGLKPEERWWLYTMTAAASGRIEDGALGWRRALGLILTENPTS